MENLNELLQQSDFIVNCLPYTSQTHEQFNLKTFNQMKPSSVFINIGRGKTVREEDLVRALEDEIISKAVLDVFYMEPLDPNSKLWDLKNVVITPHCANTTSEGHGESFKIFLVNLLGYLSGKGLENQCDKRLGY